MMGWGAGGKWQKSFCTSNELSVLIVSSQVVIAIWTGKSSRGWMGLMQSLWCPSTIDSKTEISSHMERGEEIRGSGDMETDISVSSSIHPLVLLSPSSSPLPFFFLSALFFLSPALDFGSGFAFAADSFSLSLSSRLLSPSFAAMVTTSSPTWSASAEDGVVGGWETCKSNLVQQNSSSSVQASIDKRISCRSAKKTAPRSGDCSVNNYITLLCFE